MKVLQVASSLNDWGSIERYVVSLSAGLQELGHEVAISHSHDSPLARHATVETIEISSRGKYDGSAFRRYLNLYRTRQFDIVHLHFSPDIWVAAFAAKIAKAGCVVFTRHVPIPWGRLKAYAYLRCLDHVLAVSSVVEEALIRDGVPADRVWVTETGCTEPHPNLPREEARRVLGLTGFTAGFFGRLIKEKGVGVAIEACKQAGVSLEVFGDGPFRSELESGAKELSAPVRFHGFQEEITDAMNAVDAVVVPSLWQEAFPFTVLEAMALGRPVVASRVGGLPSLVEDGSTGILVDPGNSSQLARALERLKESADMGATLGQAGRARQQARYTVEQMTLRVERAYREICKEAANG